MVGRTAGRSETVRRRSLLIHARLEGKESFRLELAHAVRVIEGLLGTAPRYTRWSNGPAPRLRNRQTKDDRYSAAELADRLERWQAKRREK